MTVEYQTQITAIEEPQWVALLSGTLPQPSHRELSERERSWIEENPLLWSEPARTPSASILCRCSASLQARSFDLVHEGLSLVRRSAEHGAKLLHLLWAPRSNETSPPVVDVRRHFCATVEELGSTRDGTVAT